jgi:hypothetical protein
VVRRDAALTEERISMSNSTKKRSAAAAAARPSQQTEIDRTGKANPGSKQARVLGMLQSPAGATIAAMMQATGWQQHSVRGFLAGVVRKRLKLKLESEKLDGNRVYQIGKGTGGRPKTRKSQRPSS